MSDQPITVHSRHRYRVVTDRFEGYEVQIRTRWWPFWRQAPGESSKVNSHHTLEAAITHARWLARGDNVVVVDLGHVAIEP